MFHFMKSTVARCLEGTSRREWFRRGGLLAAAPAFFRGSAAAAPDLTAGKLQIGREIYQSIAVRPVINCVGTITVYGGSLELPEVRAAKDAAAQHFVQLDELAEGIGRRLAELTGAEWGIVSSGCAAAMTNATSACVTGGNPELHVRVPDLSGFPKDEVVIPAHSRNQYDQAVRAVGVRIVEAKNAAEYEAALGPRVAMVYVFAGPRAETGSPNYDEIYSLAKKHNIPVLVDAAAETLTVPNVHLQRGATMVAYSGGKCLRGPQCAGLLLGRKDLLKAAWMASAPHHGHGRNMKVGKEEAVGMLAAVEMWMKRDHQAEWNTWMSWMRTIGERATSVAGVTTQIRETKELSNHCPVLSISWDAAKLGITGREVADILSKTEPRIALNARGGRGPRGGNETGVSITSYMMQPGEDKIVGDRIREVLTAARPAKQPEASPAGDLSGRWDVHLEFAAGRADHVMHVYQQGGRLSGTYQGDFVSRDLSGTIAGKEVRLMSAIADNHGAAVSYRFEGTLDGDAISGTLEMGEYLGARWTARKHPSA